MYAKQWVVQLNHTRHCAMDQSYIRVWTRTYPKVRFGGLWILVGRKNIVFGLLLPAHDDTSIPF